MGTHGKSIVKVLVIVLALVMAAPLAMRGTAGAKAPEFSLPTADGSTYSSMAHKGRRIVISFYKGYY